MRIDPTDPVDPITPDPADAAAELSAAMDAGIAAATPEPAEAPAEVPAETPAEPPVPGSPEALAAEQAAADAAKAEADPPEEDAGKAEADTFGLKGKANERFREMAAELKTLAPLKAELEKHGITDLATQLPVLMKNAKDGADMVSMVTETGATADQFGATLNYLQLVNKGDPASLQQAFDALSGELADLAKIMGKEVPGVHDPLAEHADLIEDIEKGDITRKRALEIAQSRTATKIEGARREQTNKATEQQTAAQQELAKASEALRAWEAPHLGNPLYMQRREALSLKVAQIRKDYPPALWVNATQLAFDAIMAVPVAAPPVKKPPPGPVRPGLHHGANLQPAVYDDPNDAMEAGIAAASVG